VYVYFDNDAKVRAPFDAQALIKRVNALLKDNAQPSFHAPPERIAQSAVERR
jgi:uncharacterized protein YecE (DUF72 family)